VGVPAPFSSSGGRDYNVYFLMPVCMVGLSLVVFHVKRQPSLRRHQIGGTSFSSYVGAQVNVEHDGFLVTQNRGPIERADASRSRSILFWPVRKSKFVGAGVSGAQIPPSLTQS